MSIKTLAEAVGLFMLSGTAFAGSSFTVTPFHNTQFVSVTGSNDSHPVVQVGAYNKTVIVQKGSNQSAAVSGPRLRPRTVRNRPSPHC